jgi:hypothetical protein
MGRLTCAAIVFGLLACIVRAAPLLLNEAGADGPIWIDAAGYPTRDAHEALALLRNAADEGLDPSEYDSASLEKLAVVLKARPRPSVEEVATFNAL